MSKENIRLINLNSYTRPKIDENIGKGYVLNGRNNAFYQYLIDRYNGSPTHAAIVNSYVDLIYGNGLHARNSGVNTQDWVLFKTIMKDKDIRKSLFDYVLFNEFSFQVIKTRVGNDLGSILHLPKERLAPSIENDQEEIERYFYSRDWSELTKYPATPYGSFEFSEDKETIYVGKPYKAGKVYFSDPDYLAGVGYMQVEEEISNYCVSHIKNGLSFGYIINIPDGKSYSSDDKDELERKIKSKLAGSSNAGKFVLSFNGRDAEITITPLQVNDAHKQWQFLTAEARQQIMTSHRVVSPMLFGIKDSSGFGNNADELDTAEAQLMKRVIQPKQRFYLDALAEILEKYNINLDLYFKPLTEPKEAQVKLSTEKKNLDTSVADELISLGEDITDEWELVESEVVELTSTGTAIPNAKSEIDGKKFKSRLRYTGEISSNSREFCIKMIAANKVYRIEDINAMSNKVVNEGWGPNGSNTYDILKFKGGGSCKHYFTRESYRLKADVNSPLAEQITPAKARKEGEILPALDNQIYTKPDNMPNNGFLKKR
jgi:hypothetical protein